jgi:hypothetical protein
VALKEPWALHDLRRTGLGKLSIQPPMAEAVLNHLLRCSGGKTFAAGSFLDHENPAGERPGARGHYEDPTGNSDRRGVARHRQHTGGHEQRLQKQPTCVVRSDVHSAAPHKKRAGLTQLAHPISETQAVIDFDQIPGAAEWVVVVRSGLSDFSPYASVFVWLIFQYDCGAHRRRGGADQFLQHFNDRKRA